MAVLGWGKPTIQIAAWSALGVAPQKSYQLTKAVAPADTTIEIAKNSGIASGDVIGYQSKAVACTAVVTTDPLKDVVTVTMGVTIPVGASLYEASAASASAAVDKATWTAVSPIKQGTTKITITKGAKTEAKEEGGSAVDVKYDKNGFVLEFELFAKKGTTKPIADIDGVVALNYAVRVIPEDTAAEGILIDKATVTLEETFDSAEGKKWKYSFEGLSNTGAILKPYLK